MSFILQSFGHADGTVHRFEKPEQHWPTGIKPSLVNSQSTFQPPILSIAQLGMQQQTGFENLCKVCNKSFKYKNNLVQHMKKHDASSQFKCSYCGKVCYRQDHLDSHLRIHTGEKPFKCPLCDKAFSYKQGMVAHVYTHKVARDWKSMNE
jgi:uncharacterized Zn-finger protein